jgi:DMSO/TMAO reductase YedYZ heme-binding membrane subunit
MFAAALLYAIVRYHVFGSVAWTHLPLFTMNKAVSFASAGVLAAAYLARRPALRLRYGLTGFALAVLHVLMSFCLLTPADYPKLFAGSRLSFAGEAAMLAGCAGMLALCLPAVGSFPGTKEALGPVRWLQWQRLGYAALALTALHVLAIGGKGWFDPGSWPGGMPPITLWSFVVALVPLVRRLLR